jgi:predicted membrane protein
MRSNESMNKHSNENRLWTGVFLIVGGIFYMAYEMGVPLPDWLLTWPTALIVCGVFVGVKNRFKNFSWIIMIAIGSLFLADELSPSIGLHDFIVPTILIAVGIVFILRPKRERMRFRGRWRSGFQAPFSTSSDDSEYIDDSSFLGSIHKVILSKNFKGGEINCVMGGAEIDLSQADIQQQVVLEINQVFGGTKLIVPANWNLKIEITAVLGGVEDKRTVQAISIDNNKVLILRGTAVFGGLEIKNY